MINHPYLVIKYGKYGRGLYAKKVIPKDTVIEIAPILEIPKIENDVINGTIFNNYTFSMDLKQIEKQCFVLGIASLFNHSKNSSVFVQRTVSMIDDVSGGKKECVFFEFITKREIKENEELYIDYGYDIDIQVKKYLNKRTKNIQKIKNG